ncbi:hypothetical protein IFU39_16745 [Paenibacillus sp. CFBP 13594]|uniref:hypothetical protein n=1 Tax=Paenibacillus sp. CFBP 13594 TaxID=2774037 RepID=UPI001784F6B5|nr:hypothetical protein [Paenibacillus sp. CFBP 13594]MBD8839463.1 hypothetical protein [Paenibacillus sp. CFBP 13594]
MFKLSAKHRDIVSRIKRLEEKYGCTIYFGHHPITEKIHPIKVNSIVDDKINATFFSEICSHNVAMTLENKNIIVSAEMELIGFEAMKLNPDLS